MLEKPNPMHNHSHVKYLVNNQAEMLLLPQPSVFDVLGETMIHMCIDLNRSIAMGTIKGHIARACRSEGQDTRISHTQFGQLPQQLRGLSGIPY